jgi:hypothetical protein
MRPRRFVLVPTFTCCVPIRAKYTSGACFSPASIFATWIPAGRLVVVT